MRISVAGDDATDCRCHCDQLVGGEVNCRHGPDIIGRHLSSKEGERVGPVVAGADRTNCNPSSPSPVTDTALEKEAEDDWCATRSPLGSACRGILVPV